MQTQSRYQPLLLIVAAAFFMQTLDTTIVNTALPAIARSLGEQALQLKPVVVAYTLTMAMLTPASGWLADRFGTRRVYFAAISIFLLGSLFCAGAQTLVQLTIARVLQGVGGSMLLPIGRLAVLRLLPGDQYISALAFVSIAGQAGPVFGPAVGGLLVQTVGWHWIFLINVPIAAAGLVAVRRYLPDEPLAEVAPFDFIGCGLLSLCMVAFSLGLDVPAQDNTALIAGALFALSALSVAVYVLYARKRASPLFELRLFREPNFGIGLAGNLVCRIGASAVPFLLPLLMQLQLGYSPLHSGLMMLPIALTGAFVKPAIAPLIKRYGYGKFLLVNTCIGGAAIMSFSAFSPQWPLMLEILQLAIFGAANSLQYAAMNSVTLKGLSRRDAGSGNSLFSMVQMLAIGLGVTIGGALVGLFGGPGEANGRGFALTFLCLGMITLASSLVFRRMDQNVLEGRR